MTRKIIAACAGLAIVATACSSTSSNATEVLITASDYAFELPESFGGGLVEITITAKEDGEPHEAEFALLDEGKTMEDFIEAFDPQGSVDFAKVVAGPGPVLPGTEETFTANFAPGDYVVYCRVPSPDANQTEHIAKGMISAVTVEEGEEGELPSADASIVLNDFSFEGLDGLTSGEQTVQVTNDGEQNHHVIIFPLTEGNTIAELGQFFAGELEGPPPFTPAYPGLMTTMAPGQSATRTLTLEAGQTYAFVCLIPDTDGIPHFAKGMIGEVTPE